LRLDRTHPCRTRRRQDSSSADGGGRQKPVGAHVLRRESAPARSRAAHRTSAPMFRQHAVNQPADHAPAASSRQRPAGVVAERSGEGNGWVLAMLAMLGPQEGLRVAARGSGPAHRSAQALRRARRLPSPNRPATPECVRGNRKSRHPARAPRPGERP
jgi:hypothetical protein